MSRKIPVVAIVGRTNVGKSSIFNALVGRRLAVVQDEPGVTRDRHYALVGRYDFPFTLVDTGGLVGEERNQFTESVREQARLAIQEADVVLCVFDGLHGVHPRDADVVRELRGSGKPVLWLINKSESEQAKHSAADFYRLGIPDVHCVSAVHRQGIDTLIDRIRESLSFDPLAEVLPEEPGEPIVRLAIVGRPNVGKSTLVNKLLGQERVIVSDTPGTTRDSIDTPLNFRGRKFMLVDTAGMRKKARVEDRSVEQHSNFRTVQALSNCDVAVLLLDAMDGLPSDQDATIASLIHERGRAFLIVVNKWDAIEKDHRSAKAYKDAIQSVFEFAKYAPILFVSAKNGTRCPKILEKALDVFASATNRIKTADLNRILSRAFQANPPPPYHGEPVKLFFATQVGNAPPTMVLFVNHPARLSGSYQRYLKASIRKHYPFEGIDIRILLRKRTERASKKAQAHIESLEDSGQLETIAALVTEPGEDPPLDIAPTVEVPIES